MIANIIAGLSLLVSFSLAALYVRDRRHARYQVENEYTMALLDWHREVIVVLVRLRDNYNHADKSNQNCEDLSLLSAYIEQGRFFFPNLDRSDDYGNEKPAAYRGYRNLALDFLVASYDLFKSNISDSEMARARFLQRHFTSIVFEVVRPDNRLETIRSLTDRRFVQNKSAEDFSEN